ncbi:MAG: bifunctional UDP-N-acetylglucosamine pyrophosphorylase / glucosamine-phosphate N-acetyltransferase, partial [Aliidongia sp.]|nr:bifunctional UDP-N-acetylglucosamine pyrophosphorylase / glucosamine-phosphate N-acetyltransferase [Aliidongia sp.]
AGKGTRMRSDIPKVMHKLAGQPLLRHVIETCERLDPARIVVVAGPGMSSVEAAARPHGVALQTEQRGTGHAVAAARPALEGTTFGEVLIAYGDTPLITPETLSLLLEERRRSAAAVAVLGMRVEPPNAYGRLVLDAAGNLVEIVEAAEATAEQRAITLCNSGVMAVDGAVLFELIAGLSDKNAKGEYYLTDLVGLARRSGRIARVVEASAEELAGVDSRALLAAAETIAQRRLRDRVMAGGATLTDPASVFLCADTRLGRDVVIGPNVVFGPGVTVEDRVEIKPFCHIEGALIRSGAIIGPFARLRPDSEVGTDAHIGNFVELKNARLGPGAKANHLAYLGDTEIGAKSNIGAGTITCNYDGFFKHRTVIGADVFIGTNTSLVAPVTIGDGASTAAGSVITHDVGPDALAIGRARQADKPGHAARFRDMKRRAKAAQSKE